MNIDGRFIDRRQLLACIVSGGILTAEGLWWPGKKVISIPKKSHWLYGHYIDILPQDAVDFLSRCAITTVPCKYSCSTPKVYFGGRWVGISRTDLFDNVATGQYESYSAEQWRSHYLAKAKRSYGVRINNWPDGRVSYSVIDSMTDG